MSEPLPILLTWKDGAFIPSTSYQLARCKEAFQDGKRYALIELQTRNMRRHRALFAQLQEAWAQLPEGMADDFPTVDHFRAFALIKTGWYNRTVFQAASEAEAIKLAAHLRRDSLCIVEVDGRTVSHYEAKSQAVRAMKDAEFVKSMNDVLDYAAALVGLDRGTLEQEAGRAA
jgi:hypothetical protein